MQLQNRNSKLIWSEVLGELNSLVTMAFLFLVTSLVVGQQVLAGNKSRPQTPQASTEFGQCEWSGFYTESFPSFGVCSVSEGERSGAVTTENWAPWTTRPLCTETGYCVFTSATFHNNTGISFVVVPDEVAESLISLSEVLEKSSSSSSSSSTSCGVKNGTLPCDLVDIPGKGKGLVANRRIKRGETLMVDYPAVLVDGKLPARVKENDGRKLLRHAVRQLPHPENILSLARSSTTGAPGEEDVMKTNAFTVDMIGKEYMALFPKISVSVSQILGPVWTWLLTWFPEEDEPCLQAQVSHPNHGQGSICRVREVTDEAIARSLGSRRRRWPTKSWHSGTLKPARK
jgi:hypothetical protein